MANDTTRTPLPWTVHGVDVDCNGQWVIDARTREDAQLIAQAVNNHEDLLAACKASVELSYPLCTRSPQEVMAQLRAAIAKAERTT